MIKQKISFFSSTPFTDDGVYLYKKVQVKRAILDLLVLNEYNFMPVLRPLPPILANDIRDVKYKDLVNLLHKVYNFCEFHSDLPCLRPELGVKIDSFGVYNSDGKYVKVTFSSTDDSVLPAVYQISLGDVSNAVDSFLDSCAGVNSKGVVIISAV